MVTIGVSLTSLEHGELELLVEIGKKIFHINGFSEKELLEELGKYVSLETIEIVKRKMKDV
tara:strand:- start:1046 stop:1228 length:183 start_codon:yes stop_codon:yes gene_type:complete